MIIDTEIRGIPCQIRVTRFVPEVPPVIDGPMDRADPGSPAEIEFDVLDRYGNRARWLERKIDDCEARAIEQEIIAARQAEADELAFNEYGAYA